MGSREATIGLKTLVNSLEITALEVIGDRPRKTTTSGFLYEWKRGAFDWKSSVKSTFYNIRLDFIIYLGPVLISFLSIYVFGVPFIAFCDDEWDEQTSSDRETDAGISAQESIGARPQGEGASNLHNEASPASRKRRADPGDDVGPSSVRRKVDSGASSSTKENLDLSLRLGQPGREIERDQAPVPLSPNHEEKEEELQRIIGCLPKKELLNIIGKESISRPLGLFSAEDHAALRLKALRHFELKNEIIKEMATLYPDKGWTFSKLIREKFFLFSQ